MFKKMTFSTVIFIALMFSIQQNCFAQEKTKDELKVEREVLKSEMKSEKAIERKAKYEKLSEPKISGVSSVDQLAASSTKILASSKEINTIVPEMYKRTIGETVDGVTDVTVKKPTIEELLSLSANIVSQIDAVSDASNTLKDASIDIKSAKIMQVPKAKKSLKYSKDVFSLVAPELQLNLKVVNNLISTLKSASNY